MVTDRHMREILQYSTPFILANLASIDFLNNNVQKVGGKTPFYDDESQFAHMATGSRRGKREFVSKRPTIHLKDSWVMRISSSGGVGVVRLSNTKRDSTGKWNIADLLWNGTRDYHIDQPDVTMAVPVIYRDIVSAGVGKGGWAGMATEFKRLARLQAKGLLVNQKVVRGHQTGAMTFYNRYTGRMNYNRTFRRGIRSELVRSFRQYILLCVENGIRAALEKMEKDNLLRVKVTNVTVRIQS